MDKSFDVWRSDPAGPVKGGIVVLHAVYGLTDHIGDVCAKWAGAGYAAVAPALYDRHKANVVHPYSRAGADAGIESYAALSEDDIFGFINACVKASASVGGVALSGFCTGGTWCWRACARARPDGASELLRQSCAGVHRLAAALPNDHALRRLRYDRSVAEVERIKARHPRSMSTSTPARDTPSSTWSRRRTTQQRPSWPGNVRSRSWSSILLRACVVYDDACTNLRERLAGKMLGFSRSKLTGRRMM